MLLAAQHTSHVTSQHSRVTPRQISLFFFAHVELLRVDGNGCAVVSVVKQIWLPLSFNIIKLISILFFTQYYDTPQVNVPQITPWTLLHTFTFPFSVHTIHSQHVCPFVQNKWACATQIFRKFYICLLHQTLSWTFNFVNCMSMHLQPIHYSYAVLCTGAFSVKTVKFIL
jgi:hypothetical protein